MKASDRWDSLIQYWVEALWPEMDWRLIKCQINRESAFNPNAIGVVAGALDKQPRTASEAIATAKALRSKGRNFSVGLAQINIHNLPRLGLTIEDGFDACKSLTAMQAILSECFTRTDTSSSEQTALRRTLSCYYSGNFDTGFRHGYVRKVAVAARAVTTAQPKEKV